MDKMEFIKRRLEAITFEKLKAKAEKSKRELDDFENQKILKYLKKIILNYGKNRD